MEDNIEAASEKPKRGRPRKYDKDMTDIIAGGQITTRQAQNFYSAARAYHKLEEDSRFTWLLEMTKADKIKRRGILSELGRIENIEDMKTFALAICKGKPKAKETIIKLRRWRIGQRTKLNVLDLTDELTKALNDYQNRFPSLTYQQMKVALENAMYCVEQSKLKEAASKKE